MTPANRLADAFDTARDEGRAALNCYLMAGHPDLDASEAFMRAALRHCDVLEVGVPFSDPVADGPTIQAAGVHALANGTTLDDVLALVKRLRAGFAHKGIVLMTYANPIYQRGWGDFAEAAVAAGADAVIVPDVPLEEADEPGRAFRKAGLGLVQLASPATDDDRMKRLADATDGFLYLVSSFGVTGARDELDERVTRLVKRAKAATGDVPVAVGFGVSTPDQARALADAGADGVVVGSAIVGRITDGVLPDDVEEQVAALAAGLRK